MRSLTALLLLAVLVPARSGAEADDASELVAAAQQIRTADGSIYAKTGDKVLKVSREQALTAVYSDMAAREYKKASEQAEGDEAALAKKGLERTKALHEQAFTDAKAAEIGAADLEKSSCHVSCSWGQSRCDSICTGGGGAVRGGRKLDTSLDQTLTGLEARLQETSRGFMPRNPGAMRATPHIRAGRVYEDMALAARGTAPAAAETDLSPREIYRKAGPSVVVVLAGGADGAGELGTGSVIDARGRVLTNAHVVIRDATGKPYERVRFYLKPAKVTGDPKRDLVEPHAARVARFDRELDLALLEPEKPLAATAALALGDSEAMQAGDPVVAIGHPEQGGLWTLTTGVVSTVVADLGGVAGKDAFQTDASINRGNSGGPLLDRRGRVIGVNTSMARKAADGLTITSVNFAVRSAVARRWLGADAAIAANEVPAESAESAESKVAETAPEQAAERPAAKSAAPSKPQIITERKPYRIEDAVQRAMAEMEDLEKEMREEVQKRQ